MKTLLKKALVTFFAVVLIISLFSVSASAKTPLLYDFGCFTGKETVSVNLQGDFTKFVRIEDENGEIDPQNYTVSGDEQNTTVTLKEDYLNNLENGEYNFEVYFENILNMYEFSVSEEVGILIPATKSGEFVNLTADETEVEKSNYDVEKTSNGFVITVKDEYMQALPENTKFYAHYYDNSMCYMKLQVEKQEAYSDSTTEATTPTKTEGEQQTVVFPKTGVSNHLPEIISVMLISACVLTFGILSVNLKNKRSK